MSFVLTEKNYGELLNARLKSPESFRKALTNRKRRELLENNCRLLIVAADHTARGIIGAGKDSFAIANRKSLLDRLLRSLSNPLVDGVLASADIIEEWSNALEIPNVIGLVAGRPLLFPYDDDVEKSIYRAVKLVHHMSF